jgi:hypothetical protein
MAGGNEAGRAFVCHSGKYVIEDARPGPLENSVDVKVAEADEPLRMNLEEIVEISH